MSITRTSTRLYTAMANLNHPIRSQPTGTNDITAPYQAQCWPSVKRLPTLHTIFSLQRKTTMQVHQVLKWCKWNHWCCRLGNLCSINQRPPPAFLQAISFFSSRNVVKGGNCFCGERKRKKTSKHPKNKQNLLFIKNLGEGAILLHFCSENYPIMSCSHVKRYRLLHIPIPKWREPANEATWTAYCHLWWFEKPWTQC